MATRVGIVLVILAVEVTVSQYLSERVHISAMCVCVYVYENDIECYRSLMWVIHPTGCCYMQCVASLPIGPPLGIINTGCVIFGHHL